MPESALRTVKELFVPSDLKAAAVKEAEMLPRVDITKVDVQWVQVLSEGWATPLTGFMTERQYLQSQHFNCLLSDGLVNQSVPDWTAVQPCHSRSTDDMSPRSDVASSINTASRSAAAGSLALVTSDTLTSSC